MLSLSSSSSSNNNNNANFTLKVIRFIMYTLGVLSLVLVLFMAQRLEDRYSNPDSRLLDATIAIAKRKISVFRRELPPSEAADEEIVRENVEFQKIGDNATRTIKKEKVDDLSSTDARAAAQQSAQETVDNDGRLVDIHLADDRKYEDDMEAKDEEMEKLAGDRKPEIIKQNNNNKGSSKSSDENVLVVIISNRRDGIIPTIGSIIRTSSKPVDVVLIGEHSINEEVDKHFGKRINEFTSLSVKDIEDDLVAQGFNPIWTWPEWHTSINNPEWRNENTLHVGPWDNLMTHAHVLNHIRFYLPHVSIFEGKSNFFFMDDDILVMKDLSIVATSTMGDLQDQHGLVCACNIWMWNSQCFHFEYQSKKDYILDMPSLYGDRDVCKTDSESHCVPANYWDFVNSVMPKGGKDQYAWNFGFSLFALNNWRNNQLTQKYEHVMKESYRLHVFPETSLTFGLGVSYIAFAGNVECWNDDYVQVRDGFGFIEWDRYAATFGDNFFDAVDVVHYTGPDKPWVDDSRIEERAITPWLEVMGEENMPIPRQLSLTATENLFTLLGSDRSGAQWIMSLLEGHPKVCASGEADKPETGFPADVLLPEGLPWYPFCSIKRGCTYEFINTGIHELIANMTDDKVPLRCAKDYDAEANNDPLAYHLPRLCHFVELLDGNYDRGNIARIWLDAFVQEDRSLVGCGCVRGVQAKGLKVLAEWIIPKDYPENLDNPAPISLNNTRVHGNKIIRLKRHNLWARYKSMLIAQQTEMYHPVNAAEKKTQLQVANEFTVSVDHIEWNMKHMENIDRAADQWARDHASEILWLDYEECRADTAGCFTKIYEFIGVDASHVTGKAAKNYESAFAGFSETESSMDLIANKGEVMELLAYHGWDHFISGEKYIPLQLLTFEENHVLADSKRYTGVNSTLFGQRTPETKPVSPFQAAIPLLQDMDGDSLVIISNDRDGRVNFPVGGHDVIFKFLAKFRESFVHETKGMDGAIVVSAVSECCASALTHGKLGEYVDDHNKRKKRACTSGEPNCQWAGDEKAEPWRDFMKNLAKERNGEETDYAFLDTSLIAGKARDLLNILRQLDIKHGEDDRAVFTDFLYRNPNKIAIDYDQSLFGESRALGRQDENCMSTNDDAVSAVRRLDLIPSEEQPMFVFSPRTFGCNGEEKIVAPKYPVWEEQGVDLRPILEHIDRVVDMKESVVLPLAYGRKPDYAQGPEIPYFIDDKGVWTSRTVRERTNNATLFWRAIPTENLTKFAHKILMEEDNEAGRWPALQRTVRKGGFPFFGWYGDYKTCNHKNYDDDSIPLFTTCATASCTHSFPLPNYMTIIDSQVSEENWRGVFKEFNDHYPWESKKRQIVWRGALSEAEWRDALTSVRWRAAKLVHQIQSDLFDVGLTSIPTWLTDKIDFDMSQIDGFAKGIAPMKEFQHYMAVLDMDGNSWSSRFGTLLCYNTVVVKVEPKYFEYYYSDLKPWTHFIPVKNDLSDLQANVEWALDPKNEAAVKDIIRSANQWCSHRLTPPELATDMLDIFESYVRLLDRADSNWMERWNKKREEVVSSQKFDLVQL